MNEVAEPTRPAIDPRELARLPAVRELAQALTADRAATAGNLWGASQALVLAALAERLPGPWLAILSTDAEARLFALDLETFGAQPAFLPAREAPGRSGPDPESLRGRVELARRLAGPPEERPRLIVASLVALLQPLPTATDLEREVLRLEVGGRLSPEHLLAKLVREGFERAPLVERAGEVSLRGDILDLWPPARELPVRIELFDEEIESLRSFDPELQTSVERHESLELFLGRDTGSVEEGEGVSPASLLSPTTVVVSVEPLRIEDRAASLAVRSPAHAKAARVLEEASRARPRLALQSLPGDALGFDTRSVQSLSVGITASIPLLRDLAGEGQRIVVCCQSEGERRRFLEVVEEHGGVPGLEAVVAGLSQGFRLPAARLVVVAHRELAGVLGRRRTVRERAAHPTRAIQSFFELHVGDYVVHAVHGVARFDGLTRLERGSGVEDHLHLVFADDVTLYVPASRLDVVQRYVGPSSTPPALDKIGGQSFRKKKERVQRALVDLAADLLEVHARRAMEKRPPWPRDDELVREMIAAFPYEDTPDQRTADAEVAADLASDHPMDRLLCGDVGFGKTEIAVRAAFRVVNGGGQVAVLVPTTVLAQQHYETFRERLADFPVRVGRLSRYVPPRERKRTIEAAAAGEIDILIGTHRILSKDVSLPKLGLIIVDEEQRFGVTHKEHFKKLRARVDVLTLTATPIPRTLNMSLSGVRDISALTVPPPGRQDIETVLGYLDDQELIVEAIRRELARGGQVFVLHNRVQSIEPAAARIARAAPEARLAIGHGRMNARELAKVMDAFARGDVDVLVATTIIESGLDIPAAGTILVEDADRFGLSELHQLRGRVGRGDQKAYCYLLVERTKPLRRVARERLKALEELNQLGAGFQISMKDLEIRGAGNILGPEQSGHIAAVGYDLYCRLLKDTIERLSQGESPESVRSEVRHEPGLEVELGLHAYLPEEWIPDEEARLDVLRRLSEIHDERGAEAAREMLRDRFGKVPPEAERLVESFLLKARLEPLGLTRLAWRDGCYLVEFTDRVALERWLGSRKVDLRLVRTGLAHLHPPRNARTPEAALEWLEGLLKPAEAPSRMA